MNHYRQGNVTWRVRQVISQLQSHIRCRCELIVGISEDIGNAEWIRRAVT